MKSILIAYDGSECSEAIFAELQRAGLPPGLDAHVVAVAESPTAPVPDPAIRAPMPTMFPTEPSAHAEKAEAMRRVGALAEQGAARLKGAFPAWSVVPAGPVGSVPGAIVQRAREVLADMIFVGSHSRTAVGRFYPRQRLAEGDRSGEMLGVHLPSAPNARWKSRPCRTAPC